MSGTAAQHVVSYRDGASSMLVGMGFSRFATRATAIWDARLAALGRGTGFRERLRRKGFPRPIIPRWMVYARQVLLGARKPFFQRWTQSGIYDFEWKAAGFRTRVSRISQNASSGGPVGGKQ